MRDLRSQSTIDLILISSRAAERLLSMTLYKLLRVLRPLKIPRGCNVSFIVLIPKVNYLIKLEQYKPISLVEVLHEIISKVLSNRMNRIMSSIIYLNQLL